ncbi:MAG: hypothetical protein AAB526_02470 [Patescibacteria group bacterium]
MEILIEKLKNSELFPANIKRFLIESIKNNKMNNEMLNELVEMIQEENEAIAEIDKKSAQS